MPTDIFYHFGKLVYRFRWLVIVLWLVVLMICVPFAPKLLEPFKAIGFKDPNSQSARANQMLDDKLGYSSNRFIIMYKSKQSFLSNPDQLDEIKQSLAGLKNFSLPHQIIYPTTDNKQISANKRAAYAVVLFKGKQELELSTLDKFKKSIKKPANLSMYVGGEPIFLEDTKTQTQIDLYQAEFIAAPVAIITMLIVFESVVAASLPIILGGVGAFIILMMLYFIGHVVTLSVFTLNIALLLGLCLSLDYALLLVNRYREELRAGHDALEAIAITQATAGKAVFFSGLAVFISLSALLLFPINVLFSVGMGGLTAVLISVSVALILLPAILGVLNHRVDAWPIKLFKKRKVQHTYWHWSVMKVVKKPVIFFIVILFLLLLCGYPFLHAKFGISNFRILPENLQSRQVFDIFEKEFGENKLAPILLIVKTEDHKNILTKKNIGYLYDLANQLKKDKRIESINSIVNTTPRLSEAEYKMLYTTGKEHQTAGLKKLLQITTNHDMTVMTIVSRYANDTPQTNALINELRKLPSRDHLTFEVTGASANTMDIMKSISHIFPYAFLWIVGFTYLILLILLRSVILPLKAILTTILSLCASYGLLVIVFQQGYFHHLLHFEPQGMLDISLLIIIFCALFGISMDYEVFLLTRIKEYYEQTGDNVKSIVEGIQRSSKIITSAAIIVVLLCFSFMSADILIVKAFGLGIAVAVFIDAFIIRTLLVPATMALLGKWNWYLPAWLDAILPKIAFDPEKFPVEKKH